MFRFVENQKKWVQIGLVVVSVPFIATGMLGYVDSSLNGGGAKLVQIEGGHAIPDALFEQKWAAYRQSKSSSSLSVPDQKQFILDSLIQEQLLALYTERQQFNVSAQAVQERIANEPAFRGETGTFSLAQYQTMLKQIGSSEAEFEESVRKSLARRSIDQVMQPWLAQPLIDYLISVYEMQWVTRHAVVSWEPYAKDIVIDDAAARAYYAAHLKQYAEPAKVQIETIEASADAAEKLVAITPEAIAQYYEQHKAEYISPEVRQVSHILLKVDAKASQDEKNKKKAKIEALLKELKAAPEKFSSYAGQYSEDPGSAAQGGDLGEVGKGAMVKPFEDAVFSASANSLVGPVETEFGYHLIQVGAIKPSVQKPLAEAQADVESALRRQKARERQEAWMLKLEVDQSREDLSALGKETGMPVSRSGWLTVSGVAAQLDGKQGLAAQVLENAQKGDYKPLPVQELAGQKFVLMRAVAYQAPYQPKFEDIQAKVIADAQREKAIAKAREDGAKWLKAFQAKEQVNLPVAWSAPETLVFRKPNSLSPELQKQVMQMHPKGGAPLFTGAENATGYTLVAVDAVIKPTVDDTKRGQVKPILGQLWAEQGYRAFTQGLRKLYNVEINESRWKQILARQEEPAGTTVPLPE